jgi:hypothetical protein
MRFWVVQNRRTFSGAARYVAPELMNRTNRLAGDTHESGTPNDSLVTGEEASVPNLWKETDVPDPHR